jgi:hypothetical protein
MMIKRVSRDESPVRTDVSQPTNKRLGDLNELCDLYEEVLRLRQLEARLAKAARTNRRNSK